MAESRSLLLMSNDHDWSDLAALRLVALGCVVRRAANLRELRGALAADSFAAVLVDERVEPDSPALLVRDIRALAPQAGVVVLTDPRRLGALTPSAVGASRCLSRGRPWRDIEHAVEETLDAHAVVANSAMLEPIDWLATTTR